ncbi:MAG: hypothetical protein AMK75_05930 [Planctomycetes bacterium SM23_65]|nr:MAG: hypothetical protein AMK75_05930 [Planctomycetes bacterium SM23_65]
MKLILVGQGKTQWDEESRLQGTIDLPLSPRGRKQVSSLARKLHALRPKGIVSGTGETLSETSRILARRLRCRVYAYEQLNELNHGLWEGMLHREIEERHPQVYRRWCANPQSVSPPKGESIAELLERVGEVLERLRRRHSDTIVMVLPEMVRLAAQALLTGLTVETLWSRRPTRVEWTGLDI